MGLDVPLATCNGYCHEYTKEHLKNYQFDRQRNIKGSTIIFVI